MDESSENTFTSYLGKDFQLKLMWQLLVEPEFAEKTLPNLSVDYFDDPHLKRLFIIVLEYYHEFGKVPNLQTKSIHLAINKYKSPHNPIEEETLFSVLKRIELWNESVINKQQMHDGDVVQAATITFIKQQEWRKFGEFIIEKTKTGEIRKKYALGEIEERLLKISHIGDDEDYGTEIIENIDKALRKEFRKTIPTGITVIDTLTGGGLGKAEIGLILSPSGVGKSQPLSANVLTPSGWVKMGDIKEGDVVIGSNGKSQKVLGVYPQGKRPIYKIEFSDKTSVFCDKKHIWSVNTHKQRTYKREIGGVTYYLPDNSFIQLTVDEMINDFILTNRSKRVYNYRLPNLQPVEFIEKELVMHPYVMGILLGDGCLTKNNQPHITTTDEFVVNKICEQYSQTKVTEFEGRKENYLKIFRVLLLNSKLFLQTINLYDKASHEKEIPYDYLYNSIKNREALLQGLIDSDGTVTLNGTIIYTTTSPKLARQVRELVLSLGGTAIIRNKKKQYNKNTEKVYGRESYNITISFPEAANIQPCTLPRKLERVKYRTKYADNKFIVNITYSHDEEAQCIYVENDDHLYVTDDYVLTHNTTALTKIANTAYSLEYNVCQIIFEDTVEQIQRKHYTIWTGYPLSQIDENSEEVKRQVKEKIKKDKNRGHLVIKKFSQENTTMMDIRNWISRYQKKWGYNFDIVILDYLDCLESHKKTPDRNEAELAIVKSFEAMASDLDIPAWSAIQSNRSGFDAEFVEAHQTGGSIKRIQKAHFFMSIAKTPDQKEAQLANIRIIKARFAQDGQTFKDCVFDNDKVKIVIKDERYSNIKAYRALKKYDTEDVDNIDALADSMGKKEDDDKPSANVEMHTRICNYEQEMIKKANSDIINDAQTDTVDDEIEKYKRAWDTQIDNVITTTTTEKENSLEIDDTLKDNIDISNETPSEIISHVEETTETISEYLEITGNTVVEKINEPEVVKIENTSPIIENIEKNSSNPDNIALSDPDAPHGTSANILDILNKKAKEQGDIRIVKK